MEKTLPFLSKEDSAKLLRNRCKQEGVDYTAFNDLIRVEFKEMGKRKKRGLPEKFDEILSRIYIKDQADIE